MQMLRDVHENGLKKKEKKSYEMYIPRKTRDTSEACTVLLSSYIPYFYPLFFFPSFFH